MKHKVYTMSMTKASLYSILITVVLLVGGSVIFGLLTGTKITAQINEFRDAIKQKPALQRISLGLMLPVFSTVVGLIIHELIHCTYFARYNKNGWKSVKIGVKWKYLAPYAHCTEPITVGQYRVTLIMPTIILGVIPLLASFFIVNSWWYLWGCLFIGGGVGDMMILYLLRNLKTEQIVKDHPTDGGFILIQ